MKKLLLYLFYKLIDLNNFKYLDSLFSNIFTWGFIFIGFNVSLAMFFNLYSIYLFILFTYLAIIVLLTAILLNKLYNFEKSKENIFKNNKYAKLLFEANYLQFSIAPLVIILFKLFLFDFIYFAFASIILLLVLIVITSNRFINFLFNFQQNIIKVNVVLDEFFADAIKTVNINKFARNIFRDNFSLFSGRPYIYKDLNNFRGASLHTKANNELLNNMAEEKIGSLNNLKNKENEILNSQFKNKYVGGFKSYNMINLFKDFTFTYNSELQQMNIDKDLLLKAITDFLNNLDSDKTFTVLFIVNSWSDNQIMGTLSDSSMLIHKDYSPISLCEILLTDINRYINKYVSYKVNTNMSFDIMAQYREWVNENEYGKEKFIEIKRLIINEGLSKLHKLSDVNRVISDDIGILNGLKNMNFYDFNLPFNHWFEKELFFTHYLKNKNLRNKLDIIDLYNNFLLSLNNKTEYIIEREAEKSNLKIVFRNVDVYNYLDNNNKNIKMINNWDKYGNTNEKYRFVREAILYHCNDEFNKPLLNWIDFICLDDDMINLNKLTHFNNIRVVERKIFNITFIWDKYYKILERDDLLVNSVDELFDVIRPIESIMIFNNFQQEFKFNVLDELPHEQKYDNKIGVIDLETYPFEKSEEDMYKDLANNSCNNSGKQRVYAGGWRVADQIRSYYFGDKGCENHDSLVKTMVNDIFNCGYANYTFYAHNFSRFDGHFITNSLLVDLPNYEKYDDIKLVMKDSNDLIEMKINKKSAKRVKKGDKNKYGKLKIHDSLNLIPHSLNDIAKDVLGIKGKENFPHYFMNNSTLFYEGKTPDIKFYKNISADEYAKIVSENQNSWNSKNNCLKYLEKDLDILYEAMINFSKEIWNEYGVNITRRKTISGLTLLIFQSNYLGKCGYQIPIINGPLEKYFRSAYYGGMTQVGAHICGKAFHYDMNSQYPSAMLDYLPVGDTAKLMSVNDLDSCFGIVYADIISPKIEDLRIPILPRRLNNNIIDYPHNAKWSSWYSTYDLLTARENGYIINPKIAINMEKGKAFVSFVKDIYDKKQKATVNNNNVSRMVNKLLLNTLYGRMGMKTEFYTAKIVKNEELNDYTKLTHWKIMHEYKGTNYSLIKTGKLIDSKLIDILEIKNKNKLLLKIDQKKRGSFSSIPIAVAITALARRSISKYKNIPNNPMIYSDTDSVILPKELSEECVGTEIGQMKLENLIEKGVFIGKKLYAYINTDNKVIIASAGINNDFLNWTDFENLIAGKDLIKYVENFIINPGEGGVSINSRHKFTIKGIRKDTITQMDIRQPPVWLQNNNLYSLSPTNHNIIHRTTKNSTNKWRGKRSFSTSVIRQVRNNKFSTYLDNSQNKSIINRENGIYKVYDNIFIYPSSICKHKIANSKDSFVSNLAEILEDLYDNNSYTIFNLYFLIKPATKFDIVKLNKHFSQYPNYFISENMTKFYKNTGLIGSNSVIVFLPFYDEDNLIKISSDIKKNIYENIETINKNVHLDLNNKIINYQDKVDIKSEIMLILNADFKNYPHNQA